MADGFQVDLVALHHGSNDLLHSVGEASVDFMNHEGALAETAPGWVGSSQQALADLTARWEVRHHQHKGKLGELGCGLADAKVAYLANEDESAQALLNARVNPEALR